ncbi:hypothetical protein THRCLA_22574 [Thraustotheca clavata]|uniref:Secreted protein n=1 Tax=Thraustotheca clavata TaxID=74557 RepID=A0A1V9YWL0_9STRA|nr:hypothetical protein THRCLA_22574 [Thraustotheca clavata]
MPIVLLCFLRWVINITLKEMRLGREISNSSDPPTLRATIYPNCLVLFVQVQIPIKSYLQKIIIYHYELAMLFYYNLDICST